jgi:hypothetical protein
MRIPESINVRIRRATVRNPIPDHCLAGQSVLVGCPWHPAIDRRIQRFGGAARAVGFQAGFENQSLVVYTVACDFYGRPFLQRPCDFWTARMFVFCAFHRLFAGAIFLRGTRYSSRKQYQITPSLSRRIRAKKAPQHYEDGRAQARNPARRIHGTSLLLRSSPVESASVLEPIRLAVCQIGVISAVLDYTQVGK